MLHHTDPSNGRDGPVEQELAVVEINVPAESALQQLHECERSRDDHLQNIVGGMSYQLPRRRLQIKNSSKERSRGNE